MIFVRNHSNGVVTFSMNTLATDYNSSVVNFFRLANGIAHHRELTMRTRDNFDDPTVMTCDWYEQFEVDNWDDDLHEAMALFRTNNMDTKGDMIDAYRSMIYMERVLKAIEYHEDAPAKDGAVIALVLYMAYTSAIFYRSHPSGTMTKAIMRRLRKWREIECVSAFHQDHLRLDDDSETARLTAANACVNAMLELMEVSGQVELAFPDFGDEEEEEDLEAA